MGVEQDLLLDGGGHGVEVHQGEAGVGRLLADLFQPAGQAQQARLGGGLAFGEGRQYPLQAVQEAGVFGEGVAVASVVGAGVLGPGNPSRPEPARWNSCSSWDSL